MQKILIIENMKAAAYWEWIRIAIAVALISFFSYLMLTITLPYFSFRIDEDFLATKQSIIHIAHWRYAFYIHVCTSTFVLFLGIFQFIRRIVYGYPKLHRFIGFTYVVLVVFISGPSGFIIGCYANGGLYARISFVSLSLLWMGFTAFAYLQALMRRIPGHQAHMLRSYALTLSAITLRSYAFIIPMFIHMNGRDEYVLIAWLSWLPNLIIAQLLIRKNWTSI
jgi:hypothetical protein